MKLKKHEWHMLGAAGSGLVTTVLLLNGIGGIPNFPPSMALVGGMLAFALVWAIEGLLAKLEQWSSKRPPEPTRNARRLAANLGVTIAGAYACWIFGQETNPWLGATAVLLLLIIAGGYAIAQYRRNGR